MKLSVKERANGAVIAAGLVNQEVRVFEGNWYFGPAAVKMEHLKITDRIYTCPYKGVCFWIDLEAPGVRAQNVAWVYQNPKPGYEFIKDQIAFYPRDTSGTISVKEQAETATSTPSS